MQTKEKKQIVVRFGEVVYELKNDEWHCTHTGLVVEPPCCAGSAAQDCDCQGGYTIHCPNKTCDGVTDDEWEKILALQEVR